MLSAENMFFYVEKRVTIFSAEKMFLRGETVSIAEKNVVFFNFYVEKRVTPFFVEKMFFTWRKCFHRGKNVFT